ncbi:hypothetical protein ABZV67_42330 [Streptomyces sp. NPDC005065]|uniref:hypothetical protein n=1 Tax=unclassified Streptomyces TaxID=2593676 RepID=UPI0033B355D5
MDLKPGRAAREPSALLVRESSGYTLRVAHEVLDAAVFERLVTEAGASLCQVQSEEAKDRASEALRLWRGLETLHPAVLNEDAQAILPARRPSAPAFTQPRAETEDVPPLIRLRCCGSADNPCSTAVFRPAARLLAQLRTEQPAASQKERPEETALTELLGELRGHTTVLLVDDLDPFCDTCRQLVRHLAVRLRDEPIAVLCSTGERAAPRIAALTTSVARERVLRIGLRPLSAEDVPALLKTTGQAAGTPVDHASALHRRSGGNPFALNALLELPPEQRVASGAAVPPALASVAAARLGGLPRRACAMVTQAAVCGPDLDASLLVELGGLAREVAAAGGQRCPRGPADVATRPPLLRREGLSQYGRGGGQVSLPQPHGRGGPRDSQRGGPSAPARVGGGSAAGQGRTAPPRRGTALDPAGAAGVRRGSGPGVPRRRPLLRGAGAARVCLLLVRERRALRQRHASGTAAGRRTGRSPRRESESTGADRPRGRAGGRPAGGETSGRATGRSASQRPAPSPTGARDIRREPASLRPARSALST